MDDSDELLLWHLRRVSLSSPPTNLLLSCSTCSGLPDSTCSILGSCWVLELVAMVRHNISAQHKIPLWEIFDLEAPHLADGGCLRTLMKSEALSTPLPPSCSPFPGVRPASQTLSAYSWSPSIFLPADVTLNTSLVLLPQSWGLFPRGPDPPTMKSIFVWGPDQTCY